MSLPPELQSALLGRRVVFLRGRLDDAAANGVIAELLLARTARADHRAVPGQPWWLAQFSAVGVMTCFRPQALL
jgi:hypothetical protein